MVATAEKPKYTCTYCKKGYETTTRWATKKACSRCRKRQETRVFKQEMVDYKGGCCQLCGYDACINAIDFHHVDPADKRYELATADYSYSITSVQLELNKCLALCSNCHRELHSALSAAEFGHPPSPIIDRARRTHEEWLVQERPPMKKGDWQEYHPVLKDQHNRYFLPPDWQ